MFDHIHPLILPIGFFFGICSIVGCTGNLIMLLVIYNTKRLRSPCHMLIAFNCLADFTHELGQFPFVYNVFSGTKVTQDQCFYIQMVPLTGVLLGAPLILAMGIDRLIAIVFPAKYRLYQDIKYKYVFCQLLFPCAYTIALMILASMNHIQDEFECAVPIGLFSVFSMFTYTGYILYFSIIILYIVAGYELTKKGGSKRFKSVFISMAITVGLVCFGWIVTTITNTLSYIITENDFYRAVMQQYAGITVNMATASNAFVYYAMSTEYRNSIKRLFGYNVETSGSEVSVSHATHVNASKRGSKHSIAPVA